MCGIVGFLNSSNNYSDQQLCGIITKMSCALKHRGPDDKGIWVDAKTGLALGHRRLAILDLTKDGRQPMVSYGGRYCLIFNAEIYNFQKLH